MVQKVRNWTLGTPIAYDVQTESDINEVANLYEPSSLIPPKQPAIISSARIVSDAVSKDCRPVALKMRLILE